MTTIDASVAIYGNKDDDEEVTGYKTQAINAERVCSYYGKEGVHRPFKGKTTRPHDLKNYNKTSQLPVHPDSEVGCRPDGELAREYDAYCWDNIKKEIPEGDFVQCWDMSGDPKVELRPDLDYVGKETDCMDMLGSRSKMDARVEARQRNYF